VDYEKNVGKSSKETDLFQSKWSPGFDYGTFLGPRAPVGWSPVFTEQEKLCPKGLDAFLRSIIGLNYFTNHVIIFRFTLCQEKSLAKLQRDF
jgi:hypothetical protein